MLREIRDLGFEWVELGHGIRISLLPGVLDMVQSGEIKISSVHNYCPLPIGITHPAPDMFPFSSPSARDRDNAFRYTVKTLEVAARLQAQAVVLHLGRIDMKEYGDKLLEMLERDKQQSDKFKRIRQKALEKRESNKEPYLALAHDMLKRLIEQASKLGVKLGVEIREKIEDIPLESDFQSLLKEFEQPCVGYWHDIGHAQIKENLGLLDHVAHLQSLAPRMVGIHVHDVIYPGRDHSAPGTGTVNFAALKPLLKPEHIKVFELSPRLSPEEVKKGIEHLKKVWGEE